MSLFSLIYSSKSFGVDILINLPIDFMTKMEQLLQDDYPAFLESYSRPSKKGVRLNPLKCTWDILEKNLPFTLSPSPFFLRFHLLLLKRKKRRLVYCLCVMAGASSSQEPSAASAVTVLSPQPGETVLDLCAAPGGKSTQIAGLLAGKGFLWSNEIVKNRANILLSNIERLGVRNAVVSSCHPDVLCSKLAGFFDKVLVDAPCSGEGMFRRDEQAIEDWSLEHVKARAVRQAAILDSAAQAVKENGILVYSTCTFSKEENEDTVSAFLERHPEFELVDSDVTFGRPGIGLEKTRRIYPMDGGDGHFVAKLRRIKENPDYPKLFTPKQKQDVKLAEELLNSIMKEPWEHEILQVKEQFLLLPNGLPQLDGLGVLRAGVPLGEGKTNRIEPAHGLFMAAKPEELHQMLSFANDDPALKQFLKGEEIAVPNHLKGFTGIAVEGVLTGFGKCSAGRLKNRYPKGLRNF